MEENIKISDKISICAESFGQKGDPAILLIMGASASMVWWDEEFCKMLAGRGRFVIRYDNRDVGRSTVYEPGTSNYDVVDMANDAIKVLDHYSINKAHIAGMSLGGMLAQLIALRNPERVLTLTMMSSGIWDERPDLPPIDEKVLNYISQGQSVDWTDHKWALDFMVGGWRLQNGSRHEFDKARALKLAETELNRALNIQSMFNHGLLKGGESYYGRSSEIKAPALVIHGTEDPVLPFPHALAIVQTIPDAKLLTLEGRGHEIHYNDWEIIIEAIVEHTSGSNEEA